MSLLLDALKRAELEKSARQSTAPSAEAPRAEAPRAAPAPAKPVLELQPVADPLRGVPPAAKGEAREAAAALMQAKLAADKPGLSKASIAWTIVAVAIVLVGVGAGYVWYAMQPTRAPATVSERKRAIAPPPMASASPVAPVIDPLPTAAPRPFTPARVPAPAETASADGAAHTSPAPARREAPPDSQQQLMANLLKEAATPVAPPVKFSRAEPATAISPELRSGYAALVAGDLQTARRTYQAALTQDPSSVDALLGIATVDARLGHRDAARAYYRKVLEIDPRNATALAGLGATAQAVAPDVLESQLRAAIARDPDSAALHFTLGGLYASQSRWTEAQAQLFDAHRLDPANADCAFNLAVSLDHLGKPQLAAQYYGRALAAAESGAAQFDRAAARRRVAEIAR
jgi:Tfp pilus assembly protein PilF